jgi:hypothetical protein
MSFSGHGGDEVLTQEQAGYPGLGDEPPWVVGKPGRHGAQAWVAGKPLLSTG